LEQLKEGCNGRDGPSVFDEITEGKQKVKVLRDRDVLAACHDVVVGPMHSYMFNESKKIQHGELTSEESNELFRLCREHGIAYHYYPPTGMSNHSNFIKVAQYGSEDWDHVWQGLEFNAPEVIRIIRKLHGNGDKAVKAGEKDKRNSIHFDGGFTCASYNHLDTPEEAPTITSFPKMNNEPKEGNPPEYGWLYEHVADVDGRRGNPTMPPERLMWIATQSARFNPGHDNQCTIPGVYLESPYYVYVPPPEYQPGGPDAIDKNKEEVNAYMRKAFSHFILRR